MAQVANFQVPAHPSGLEMRTQLNQIILALVSQNAGPIAPVQTYPLMWWGDTTANRLRIRNMANDAWTDLGPIDDFLRDIRQLVTDTAATKVNRSGDTMTGTLIMRNGNTFYQNPAGANYGYIGAFGNAGQPGSGIGFVDSSLTMWNLQIVNNGDLNVRGTGTVNGAWTILGGRLNLRQAGGAQFGEMAIYSNDATVMFMRGRGAGGGMEWVNNNYNNICGTMDNNGTLTLANDLVTGNGNGRVSGTNGDLYGTVWGGWLATFLANNKADRNANCQHNSGFIELGGVNAGQDGYSVAGNPWVMVGLRTQFQTQNTIWPQCVYLRNN